jgi:hypothetical protein
MLELALEHGGDWHGFHEKERKIAIKRLEVN